MNEILQEFVIWEVLAGFGGCLVMVILLTQILKGYIKIPAQIISYVLAVAILILSTAFTAGLTFASAFLTFFNATIVSFAANGGYEIGKKLIGGEWK